MAINLATKYSPVVDEVITQESRTNELINRNISFLGVKTVKVWSVTAADEGNYTRSGTSRYGSPAELADSVQELSVEMDRAFTFTIDKGNDAEQLNAKEAGSRLRQQLREKTIPGIDLRRIAKGAFGAGTIAITTLSTSNAYTEFIKARTFMTNANVIEANRMSYISAEYYELLQQDDKFNKACNASKEQANSGMISMVDGSRIKVQPASRMPFGLSCLTFDMGVVNAADKLNEYKIHDNPPGINGWLIEGRTNYDAWILTNQAPRAYAIFGQLRTLSTTSAAGVAENGTLITFRVPYQLQGITGITAGYLLGDSSTAAVAVGTADDAFTAVTITPTATGGSIIAPTEIAASRSTHIAVGIFLDGECIGGDTLVTLVKGEAEISE